MSILRFTIVLIPIFLVNCVLAQSHNEDALIRLDKLLQNYVDDRQFSGSLWIEKDGELIFSSAHGAAIREQGIPFKKNTAFSIGTLSQHFNAVATMLLVEAGKLNLDDPIAKYLDEVPKDKKTITIRHLLAHTSGLPDFYANRSDHFKIKRKEAIRNILKLELKYRPGKRFAVSNSGYNLLAAIIEEVTNRTYREFVQTEIFDRGGMSRSGFHGDQIWGVTELARGYGFNEKNKNMPNQWPAPSWMIIGTSDMVSSADDLFKWWTQLLDGQIVTRESLDIMMSEQSIDKTKRFIRYGIGFKQKETEHGNVFYYNGGGEYGQICSMRYYPESDVKMILLSNVYTDLNSLASVVISQAERALFDPGSFFLRDAEK